MIHPGYKKHSGVVEGGNAYMNRFWQEIESSGRYLFEVAEAAGHHRQTLHSWKKGNAPSLVNLENFLLELGCGFKINDLGVEIAPSVGKNKFTFFDKRDLHWIVIAMFESQISHGITIEDYAERCGLNKYVLRNWKYGRSYPTLNYIEKVFAPLGKELVIVKLSPEEVARYKRKLKYKKRDPKDRARHWKRFGIELSPMASDHARLLFSLVEQQNLTLARMNKISGCSDTLRNLAYGSDVTVDRFDYLFESLGYKMRLTPRAPLPPDFPLENVSAGLFYHKTDMKIPATAHWSVRRLFIELHEREIFIKNFADMSGCHENNLHNWRTGGLPFFQNIRKCLNILGLEFTVSNQ